MDFVLQKGWDQELPKELKLITNNGSFILRLPQGNSPLGHKANITNLSNCVQITYKQNTLERTGDPTADGEPDYLEFDISVVKDNNGVKADPNKLKLNVEISYGDAMNSHFTIEDNKVNVVHYTGINSKYDKDTYFGFSDLSIKKLVKFFNSFGFNLNPKDFTFLDNDSDSYVYTEAINLKPGGKIIVIDNTKNGGIFLDNILNYLRTRGTEHIVVKNQNDLDKNKDGALGYIATSSDKSIMNETDLLVESDKPFLGIGYGMLALCKSYGSIIEEENIKDNVVLDDIKNSLIFKNARLDKVQVSFNTKEYPENCPSGFKPIAYYNDILVGVEKTATKQWGVLFHPEDIEDTYVILDNFLDVCLVKKTGMKYIKTYENFINGKNFKN